MRGSVVLFVSLALTASAQAPQPTAAVTVFHPSGPLASFEVATIKKADPSAAGPSIAIVGARSQTTKAYIQSAYSPSVFSQAQVVGGPPWIATDTYTIQGKTPDDLRAAMNKMTVQQQGEQTHMMQQSLLADRFKLKVHFEVREMPIYELIAAKGGLKLKEVPPPPEFVPGGPRLSAPTPGGPLRPGTIMQSNKGGISTLNASATTMASVINLLRRGSDMGDRPIVDKTGFTGNFDIVDLEWAGLNAGPNVNAPSLTTALEEKLGVKLAASKGLVEVVVIDSIERPSEN